MSFRNSIENRYTTKAYDSAQKLSDVQIEDLQKILRLSPSSINSQPWQFTFVRDQKTKEILSEVSWLNKEKVIDADSVIVFSRINSIQLFEEQIERELPEGAVNYYKEFIKPLPEAEIKSWFDRQVYLALGVFLSACAEMGIDSTPMEGIEPYNYDKILDQTDYHAIVAVAIGQRDPEDFNQPQLRAKSRMAIERVIKTI